MTIADNELSQLLIYRNILQDEIVQKLYCALSTGEWNESRYEISYDLINQAERLGLSGNLVKSYFAYLIFHDENVFSITAEKNGKQIGPSLYQATQRDVFILKNFISSDWTPLGKIVCNYIPTRPMLDQYMEALHDYLFESNNNYTPAQVVDRLIDHYVQQGCGAMAGYIAFRWNEENGVTGIEHHDPIKLNDIIGYERQKAVLIKNTAAFVAGMPANNVLLVGDRGTGKSSSIKALVNHFASQGLRLIQVAKHELKYLPAIMNTLRNKGKKFIIFLDDLSFEEFEVEYKYLKSIMEGGAEAKPDNVLIYATSNRRHLIRETWDDRNGGTDEIHRFDTVNEKVSLSDRFGITLTYISPTQDEYLQIVTELAKRNNILLLPEQLKSQALQWEMAHSGRSGRMAQQLIAHLRASQV